MAQDKDQKTLNVPPLRFPGFTDEWKKTTLGEIGETMIGLTYSPKDVVENGGTIVFRSSNIQNGMIDYSDLVRVTKPIKERIITKEKDILICARNGSQRLIGKNTLLRESDAGNTFGAFMMVYRSDDNDIIHPLLSTKQYVSQVAENLGARINQITTSDLNSFEFFLPQESEEKRKIGELFALINERIATQNKIIEDLKKLKSAIIDKLLGRVQTAQSDRMVKLGEIGKFTRGLTYSAEDIVEDGGIVVVRANNLSNGEAVNFYNEIVRVDKPISDSQLLKYGDMVICMANGSSALVGKASYYNETTDSIATIGAFCGIYRSDKKIVRWLLQTNKYKRVIHKSLQGGNGAIANLTPNDILGLSFIIPKQEPSIVELLQGFDEKLDIEISLLHSLQKEKQYLLSQMFI